MFVQFGPSPFACSSPGVHRAIQVRTAPHSVVCAAPRCPSVRTGGAGLWCPSLCLTALGLQYPVYPPPPGPFLSPNYDAHLTPRLREAAPPPPPVAVVPLALGDRESCPQAGPRLAALAWGRSQGGVRA